jgi:cytoplasmic iron level regulating protein YaaA (DUF328/UPF0246 family)
VLLVISPAKTLDFSAPAGLASYTVPEFLDRSQLLVEVLREYSPAQLSLLMKISDELAQLNAARFQGWQQPFTPSNAKQAIAAFRGDVYLGLQAETFNGKDIAFAQKHLRILSGLYGVLRPQDLIQPYRLEMGTRLANSQGKDLYAFWGDIITEKLNRQLQALRADTLVNLASEEYFKAVKPGLLKANIITPVFKDLKNGQYKIISFYAKKARGMMASWIIRQQLKLPDSVREFGEAGYYFSAEQSTPGEWVFLRDAPGADDEIAND